MPARIALASLAASLLLICGYFALGAPTFELDADRQRYVLLAVALALPYAGAAGLLLCARRSLGLALAVGIGGVASVMLGPVIAVLVLFAGFASSTQQLQSIGLAALFAPVQLLLTLTALRAHRALPATEKRSGAFGIGVATPLAYGFIVATAMQWQVYDAKSGERGDAAAHRAVHEIVRCAWAWADAHSARGFPPDLAALGPAGSGCLDEQTVKGELAAHHLSYQPAIKSPSGRVELFDVCAAAQRRPRGGGNTYVVDESGLFLIAQPRNVEEAPPGCAEAWGKGPRRAKHCLVTGADPASGHPREARALSAALGSCLGVRAVETKDDGLVFDAEGERLIYRPGTPDAAGIVREFELAGRSAGESWLLDETGRIHLATGRDATRSDPTDAERKEIACRERGDADACQDAGRAFEGDVGVRPDPARAAALYELGCEAGLARGCLSAASLYAWDRSIGGDWPRVARLNRRACDLGDAQGCAAVWDARAATVVR